MKVCSLVKASLWNEIAVTLAEVITEIEPMTEGKGACLSLWVSDLSFHLNENEYYSPDNLAYSERCFIEHTPTKFFMENPVLA